MYRAIERRERPGEATAGVLWLDVVEPTAVELESLGDEFNLSRIALRDCLEPVHLPQFRRTGNHDFLILRAYDDTVSAQGQSIQALTRKVAFFIGPDFLVTVHRKDQPFLARLREHAQQDAPSENRMKLLAYLMAAVFETFEPPLLKAEGMVDRYESQAIRHAERTTLFRDLYDFKQQLSMIRRTLWRSISVVDDVAGRFGKADEDFRHVSELARRLQIHSDDLEQHANNVVNLKIALNNLQTAQESQRTNDIMRTLTIFSVYFMPLTFITSIYGMNFEHMPELNHDWAYPAVLLGMATIAIAISIWFRRRGWF